MLISWHAHSINKSDWTSITEDMTDLSDAESVIYDDNGPPNKNVVEICNLNEVISVKNGDNGDKVGLSIHIATWCDMVWGMSINQVWMVTW